MNIKELEKIIKQIEKYQLWDEIKDVEKWFESLTNKEIDNFIKLNVKVTKSIIKYKHLLISLLDSDYYLHDIKLISNAKTDRIAYCLSYVTWNRASLESPHHEKDMELIANARTDYIAGCLSDVARDRDSLNSSRHEKKMQQIANAKDDIEAKEIYKIIIIDKLKIRAKGKLTNEEKIDIIYENAIKYVDKDDSKELPEEVFKIKNN